MNLSKVCKGVRQLKKYGPFLAIFFIALAFLMPHLFTHKLILVLMPHSITIGSMMPRNKLNMGISIIFLPFMDSSKVAGL